MITDQSHKKIRFAIIVSSILKEPLACLYPLLPFFLLKDLSATALHIVLYSSLKPIASFFSFYFSEVIAHQRMTLKSAMIWAGILARLCFIPALIYDDVNLYIFGSTMYMIFTRSETPAWMEAIKINVFRDKWEKTFSTGSILSYVTSVFITIFFVASIEISSTSWKYSFLGALCLGMLAVVVQALLIENDREVKVVSKDRNSGLIEPVKGAISLLRSQPDFARFQGAFMIGGLGLMIIQPVIPIYFTEVLSLKYSDLMIAFCVWKALGFVSTTPLWNRLIKRIAFSSLVFLVLCGFSLFSLFLIFSSLSINAIYLAYFVFGVSQAGSHLVWHMSGPIFSKDDSSTSYTSVNVVMVGIRGLVGPMLGWLLMFAFHPTGIFFVSMLLCLSGQLFYLVRRAEKKIA
jgi:hypothetical protein